MLRKLLNSANRIARHRLPQRRFFSKSDLLATIRGKAQQIHNISTSNSSKLVLTTLSFGVGYALLDRYKKSKKENDITAEEKTISTEKNNITTEAAALTPPPSPELSATDIFIKSLVDAKNGTEIEKILMNTKINEVVKDFKTLSTLFKDLLDSDKSDKRQLDRVQQLYIISFFSDAIINNVTTAVEIRELMNDTPYVLRNNLLKSMSKKLPAIVNDYQSLRLLSGITSTNIFEIIPTAEWKKLFLQPEQMSLAADRINDIYGLANARKIILESFTNQELRQIYDEPKKLISILRSIAQIGTYGSDINETQVSLLERLGNNHIHKLLKTLTPIQQSDFVRRLPEEYRKNTPIKIDIERVTEERLSSTRVSRP